MNKFKLAFNQTMTDKGYMHGYDRWYSKIFKNYNPSSLLEIGVQTGRSLAAWKLAFPDCDITGVDISDQYLNEKMLKMSEAKIILSDSTKKDFLTQLNDSYDVIIDDGSHYYKDIIKTFSQLKDKFNHVYIIEDAMYKKEFTIKYLNRLGFNNIEIYPSHRRQVHVNRGYLHKKIYKIDNVNNVAREDTVIVDLDLIVIYKN